MLLAGLFVLELLNPLPAPKPWVVELAPLPDEQVFTLWGQSCIRDEDTHRPISFLCQHDMRSL